VLAPGSESHTAVALKYDSMLRDRLIMAENLFKKVSCSPFKGTSMHGKSLRGCMCMPVMSP